MSGDYVLDALGHEVNKYLFKENVSKEDLEKLIDDIDFRKLADKVVEKLSNETVEFFKHSMYKAVAKERTTTKDFLRELNEKYLKAFTASEAMYIMVTNAGSEYSEFVSKLDKSILKERLALFTALREIHIRACQQYDEIICLITNGFADGALARWRSLYELSIIAYFIREQGEDTAKSFVEQAISNDRYDWAKSAKCFKDMYRHISFKDILRNCSFKSDKWTNIYNTANKLVHASPQGTFDRLGRGSDNRDIILAGRSDYGLALPAEAAAISLNMINEIFLSLFPNGKSAVCISYINKWTDIINEYYS